jgi:ABC-type branched-subunit amino acid transport system ATPase component
MILLAVETDNLAKSHGTVTALACVDLAVLTGTVLGLLWPNGAGKATTISFSSVATPASEEDACTCVAAARPTFNEVLAHYLAKSTFQNPYAVGQSVIAESHSWPSRERPPGCCCHMETHPRGFERRSKSAYQNRVEAW